ncbi:GPW/gp25 family protein [Ectothiorhodospira lacustris]|uniref:GPW/gp25 family protein n=1 Tax=Ectothiorhodospira lacustris TaxID=2899127 RepID=UPI001EE80B3D|nr:GPW/gp25 family protein [Ectothiorhodospira lacustris]MCG5501136.1 GPW/gp25 family protein [Ectothiorhodospira lacustris]
MKRPTDRAWWFALPMDAAATDPIGPATGPRLTSGGGIAMIEEEQAVRQSVLLLLSTCPGERVMRPDYGCRLHRLVFAPNDTGTAGLAIHYVGEAIRRWEPRAVIIRLEAGSDLHHTGNPAILDIVLHYRLRDSGEEGELALGFDLRQGGLHDIGGHETPPP